MLEQQQLVNQIRRLKEEREAIILSHVYQRPEVQDIADFVGDSLELSRRAATTDARVIVFCGVHFMAESAYILSPDKTVLLPDLHAGCPMADMVDAVALERKKMTMPEAVVVCYVNTSAEVKALCDIACTSANAVKVIDSIPADTPILFVPDQNLGNYVAKQSGRSNITVWEGYCNTHQRLTREDVLAAREKHPRALVLVHPECRPEVVELADVVASTTGMLRYAEASDAKEFLVCTEQGILHQFHKRCPGKSFYLASEKLVCPNMKKITLEKVYRALLTMTPQVTVPEHTRQAALRTLDRMLAIQ
ncbi:MAG: quinolinate synthase NadA [Desulfurispora sp.]|uniref:quinolinate synthase NadA n=1 Tax=Desulfurispora sp. TaxID=3014275 RepID=UPI00404A1621